MKPRIGQRWLWKHGKDSLIVVEVISLTADNADIKCVFVCKTHLPGIDYVNNVWYNIFLNVESDFVKFTYLKGQDRIQ